MNRALFIAALVFSAPASAETRFFSTLGDIPIAPGLTEAGGGAGFDGPEGDILVAFATGEPTPQEVRDFYLAALAPLGWALSPDPGEELVFRRGRARLTLSVTQQASSSVLRVELVRRAAPSQRD